MIKQYEKHTPPLWGADEINANGQSESPLLWILILVSVICCFILFTFWPRSASAQEIPCDRAVNAIIGEAEGEGAIGMEAVACAIRNRGTLKGVYGEKAPRVINRQYSEKTYYLAKSAWVVSENKARCEALIHGANMWEGTAFKTPSWARGAVVTATIKNQRFYKLSSRK